MYTPNPELEKIRRKKEAAEKKIEQYRHKIQRLENRKKYYEDGERAKRTHRLCNLGGTIESIAPQVKDLTRTEMTELMEYIFGLDEVKRAMSHMAITHISNINRAKEEQNIGTIPVFYDTHEPIVAEEVFEKVQQIRQQRHRKTKSGRTSMFSGLVFCADCGEKLYYGATNNGKVEGAFFDCSLHWKRKDTCGTHFIRESVLNRMVLRHIQLVTGYILHHRQHFISVMGQKMRVESAEKIQISKKQLERNEKRIAELKRLFIKIYEDNAKGKLSDERFDMMSQSYEAEQKQLEAEVIALREEIQVQERQNENIEKFIQTAHKYVDIEELDPYALRELVQAIYVDAPDKSSGKRRQNIHIKYDGIGFIPLNELMQKETA